MRLFTTHIFKLILAGILMGVAQAPARAQGGSVPAAETLTGVIFNYRRTTPQIATSGVIRQGGVAELKRLGFKTILDLRTAPEGTAREQAAVAKAGMDYYNIEISRAPITPAQVKAFGKLVANKANYPILVHCASGNRVGAMWVLQRIGQGVPADAAFKEGRAIGLAPGRERQVRQSLANN